MSSDEVDISDDQLLVVGAGATVPTTLTHGRGCDIGPSAYVGSGSSFEDDVRVGAHATVMPAEGANQRLLVRSGVRIGAGAVVCGPSVIERGARIEPGAVVTSDVPPYAIVAGNPGRVMGYSAPPAADGTPMSVEQVQPPSEPGTRKVVGGASLVRFHDIVDLRGKLTFAEVGGQLPFDVDRFFLVHDVPSRSIRGEHAHRTLHELLIAVAGGVRVSITDGHSRCEVLLDSPDVGLHLPTMVWTTQYDYSPEAVLLVLCSEPYDPRSYIRDYDEFLRLAP